MIYRQLGRINHAVDIIAISGVVISENMCFLRQNIGYDLETLQWVSTIHLSYIMGINSNKLFKIDLTSSIFLFPAKEQHEGKTIFNFNE